MARYDADLFEPRFEQARDGLVDEKAKGRRRDAQRESVGQRRHRAPLHGQHRAADPAGQGGGESVRNKSIDPEGQVVAVPLDRSPRNDGRPRQNRARGLNGVASIRHEAVYRASPSGRIFGMTFDELLGGCRLIASVQASEGSSVDDPATLARLAQTSVDQGVMLLRLQGVDDILAIRGQTGRVNIGLIKRRYEGSEVYITATAREVDELMPTGSEIIALDGTARPRPGNAKLSDLIDLIHAGGRLAMADCDSVESARYSIAAGADVLGTTLAGYTDQPSTPGPDLELLRQIVAISNVPVIAEGRYAQRWHVESALRIGAAAVVVGGALNDPVKTTRALLPEPVLASPVGAVDIGGTWLRFALFSPDWRLISEDKIGNPKDRESRLAWIREQVVKTGVERIGLSTGGIVDPTTGICWTAKEYLMPDQIGIEFSERTLGVKTYAHGDGHATAWDTHAYPNLPVAAL